MSPDDILIVGDLSPGDTLIVGEKKNKLIDLKYVVRKEGIREHDKTVRRMNAVHFTRLIVSNGGESQPQPFCY